MKGLRQLCDENGILLISDEVMAAWGRSGKWFGIDNFDVVPDIISTAKGITSGYVQLGATIWSKKIWDYFQERKFTSGLTYCGHALACACGIANIEEYKTDNLIEKSAKDGEYLASKLKALEGEAPLGRGHAVQGPVGVHRAGVGQEDKGARLPATTTPSAIFPASWARSSWTTACTCTATGTTSSSRPPLTITRPQIDEMVAVIEKGLDWTDTLVKKG